MSSLSPYELTPHNGGYNFTTDAGVAYYAYFSDVQYIYFPTLETLAGKILAFGFHALDARKFSKTAPDARVMKTLAGIVEAAFAEHTNAVIYLVDNRDSRQAARARKFRSWYRRRKRADIEMFNGFATTAEGDEVISALLLHSSHPQKEQLVYLYYKMMNELGEPDA